MICSHITQTSSLTPLSFTGSGSPTPCPGGKYCQTPGLPLPTDDCDAGFYCIGASTTGTPEDGVEGDICPPGFYCGSGSEWPEPCPPGSFSPYSKNVNVSDCEQCLDGEYCGEYNLTDTNGKTWLI